MKNNLVTYRVNYSNHNYKKRDRFINTTKEERAKELCNIICPKCHYQNHKQFVLQSGKCHLCHNTIDVNYFKKTLLKKLKDS